jgi:hypothetical protein
VDSEISSLPIKSVNSVVVSRHVREVFFHHGGPRFNPGFAPIFSFALGCFLLLLVLCKDRLPSTKVQYISG